MLTLQGHRQQRNSVERCRRWLHVERCRDGVAVDNYETIGGEKREGSECKHM
jgi:hypothetical protein